MNIAVSADSTCDLLPETLQQYNIRITPLYITLGEECRRDGIDCRAEDLFAYTERTGLLAGTAAVTIADYLALFAEELEENDAVIHFTISSEMSSCYQNACIAAAETGGEIHVIDARNLSSGIGLLALSAVELAREGKTAGEIAELLEEKKNRLNVSFVLDTLEYLHKGGRCSGVAALGANLLKLRPCIEVREGVMGVGKKYRGKLEKCWEAYIRDRLEGREDVDTRRIFITDSGTTEERRAELEALVRSLLPFEEVLHAQSGCTISGHCGPNCMGILYFNK